ncbi:M4 family metallopeptidase [Adhaeribacter radiodurans]|uniref:M4 family metallopeptidase n=1 Tax=Adhaeribacter radiodurans TaxID=2745197 RepID=A0A7L7LAX0_9BACT|nr:M4 family metallopeptidase [Adhaeribacter radiodurans]QMU29981.1 M4 family metallopeptidase [Adhaeribacter radiodurans]
MKMYKLVPCSELESSRKWWHFLFKSYPNKLAWVYAGKNKFLVLLVLSVIGLISPAMAQVDDINQSVLAPLLQPSSRYTFLRFKEGVQLAPQELFKTYSTVFGLTENDVMTLQKSDSDKLGFIHYRFQQVYKQIPVEGGEFIVHQKGGELTTANGRVVPKLNAEIGNSMPADAAIDFALRYTNAKRYKWQLDRRLYPKPTLVFTPVNVESGKNLNLAATKYRLAYKMDIFAAVPFSHNRVYVDAYSGEIIKTISLIQDCTNATAATLYNGNQSIQTELTAMGNYRLFDNCRSDGACGDVGGTIRTRSLLSGDLTNSTTNWAGVGASAHWALEKTYDYYNCTFGRQSYDGANAVLNAFINDNAAGRDNAFWDSGTMDMHFGDGGGGATTGAIVSLDVVGHELTHAFTQFTAGLVYSNESGALNESFSDIFGTAVEYYGQGGTGDYDIGEDMWIPGGKLRSMSNPNDKNQPDTYLGTNWYSGVLDHGGVHTNSGVQNFWFYLLSEGGTGTNDISDSYNVTGIGRDNALAISYQALTYYMNSMDQYIDSRYATIQAAEDLFGACSPESYQVANAWYAVGVGGPVGDLWSKDRPDDTGNEPNNISSFMWGSEDIWVRKQNDGLTNQVHQNPEYRDPALGVPNYVYVRVRNRSCTSSGSGNVNLYWAKASTGLSWPSPWTGAVMGGLQMGSPIATLPTGTIAASGETILEFPWYPPNPADYSGAYGLDFSHFCLLSRIETSTTAPFGMTFPENTDLNLNVKKNNNIAWKNITVVDEAAGDGLTAAVAIGNYLEQERLRTKLVFSIPKEEKLPFTAIGVVRISLGEKLFKKWLEGDRVGEGIKVNNRGEIYLSEPTAWIGNIILSPQEVYGIKVLFDVKEKLLNDSIFHFDVTQYRTDNQRDSLVGGERFEINTNALLRRKKYPKQIIQPTNNQKAPEQIVSLPLKNEITAKAFPNPTSASATIQFYLPKAGNVELSIYNAIGNKVTTLVNGSQNAGFHEVLFQAEKLPKGIYFYRLNALGTNLVKRILLTK